MDISQEQQAQLQAQFTNYCQNGELNSFSVTKVTFQSKRYHCD